MAAGSYLEYVEPLTSVIGAALAIYAAIDARMSAKKQRMDTAAASEETKRQGAIALEAMLIDYHKAILAWADESIDWMSRAHSLTFFDPARIIQGAFDQQAECLWHISSLIDRGRLFFPNEDADKYGLHKPKAYRGFSPVVLDQLKEVHGNVWALHNTKAKVVQSAEKLRAAIIECKRQFVCEVQEVVDPQARQSRLTKILSASSASAAVRAAVQT